MGTYSFNNGAGQVIVYGFRFGSDGTPLFSFDDASKNAACIMYVGGQPDTQGIQNFAASLADAIRVEQELMPPTLPRTPDMFIDSMAQRATSEQQFKPFCQWSENNDSNSELTIRLSDLGQTPSSDAQLRDSTGLLIADRQAHSDGSSTETVYDFDNSQSWSQRISTVDSDGHTTSVDITYDDGSRTANGYDESGFEEWHYQQDADGSGTLTRADGTSVDVDGGSDPQFTHSGGDSPQITIGNGDDGPEVSIGIDPSTGSTSVSIDGGTSFTTPDGSQVSVGPDGSTSIDIPNPGSGGGWGMGEDGGGSGAGPGASFGHEHPEPLVERDPLVLDLNGDGIQLTSVSSSNAHFDYGNSGFSVLTGWVAPTEGILIRDIDHDPNTVNADELFGASSGDGFTDLAQMDTNGDGKIDASDIDFSDLKVWVDANGDGVADSGEVIAMADAGIAAINLNTQESGQHNNGNTIVSTATFVRTNGTTATVAEVNFATNTLYARYTPPEGFQYSTSAFFLPNLIGYGTVPNLIYSMSMDSTLEDAARQLVLMAASMSGTEFRVAFESLLQQWAGASNIDPTSEGPLVNARHMAVVESFYGKTFAQANGANVVLNAATAANIEATYQSILDELQVRFAAQVPLSQLLNGVSLSEVEDNPLLPFAAIKFNAATDSIDVNFDALVGSIVAHAPETGAEQLVYYDSMARLIHGLRVDLFHEDSSQLSSAFEAAATTANLGSNLRDLVLSEFGSGKGILVSDGGTAVSDTARDDAIVIDEGGHTISDSGGSDSYFYTQDATGDTTIRDEGLSGQDRLIFTDLSSDDVSISRNGDSNDLGITVTESGATITIRDQFLKFATGPIYTEMEQIKFADGIVWTPNDIRMQLLAQAKTASNDTIYGFHTADVLDGGAGDDLLIGNGGGDTFIFDAGYGHDTVDAYIVYVTRDQPDTVQFGAGLAPASLVLSRAGDDLTIDLAGTGDRLTVLGQFSALPYSRVESFAFAGGTTWTWQDVQVQLLASTSGNDTLLGYTTDDFLDGGAGNDLLMGRGGDDTYVFGLGYGRDTVDDDNASLIGDAPDRVLFNAGVSPNDLEFVRVGASDLVIRINGTDDELAIKGQFVSYSQITNFEFASGSVLTAADIEDIIDQNGPGHVTHRGTAAAETIAGTSVDDIIDGRGDNDVLRGDWGSDTYLFAAGSGSDTVEENGLGSDVDVVKLIDLNAADVTLGRAGYDLSVTINASGERLTVAGHFEGTGYGIEQIAFADGTTWDRARIESEAWYRGTDGNDTIVGSGADNVLDGRGGDDLLKGGFGSDTYVYRAGDDNDSIQEEGLSQDTDRLKLVGLNSGDVTLGRAGLDLFVTVNASNEVVRVINHFDGTTYGLEQLVFADGTTWDRNTIQAQSWFRGTSAAETITGSGADDTFDGLGGDDLLKGGFGSDTYVYRAGSGNDSIQEEGLSQDTDRLTLVGLNSGDVTLGRTGLDLFVTVNASNEVVRVINHFDGTNYGIEQLVFADGTTWDRTTIQAQSWFRGTSAAETITGSGAADTFDGLGGDDLLKGSFGSDTYVYRAGSGNDSIQDEGLSQDVDKLKLIGLNSGDVTLGRTGLDLYVTVNATGEVVRVINHFDGTNYGLEQLVFADGTAWDRNTIQAQSWFRGTAAAETITGTGAWETFDGLGGNDLLKGSSGSDTYIYRVGSGNDTVQDEGLGNDVDKIRLIDLNAADVTLARLGWDLFVTINTSGETLKALNHFDSTNYGLEQLVFADGTTWDRNTIQAQAWYRGTNAAETITGSSGAETIQGRGGDDTLRGTWGSDTYVYAAGDGNDLIQENGYNWDSDTLRFTNLNASDLTFVRSVVHMLDLLIIDNTTNQTITVQNHFDGVYAGIEQLQFADGTLWDRSQIQTAALVRGTSAAETLSGSNDPDTLDGLGGNDTLRGGNAGDTYIYGAGSGNDKIIENSDGAATDKVKLVNLNASDLTFSRSGDHLYVTINGTGERLTVQDHFFSTAYGVELIEFADGTTWDRSQILSQSGTMRIGTPANDTLTGASGADAMLGYAGADTLSGADGNDLLDGGLGSDQLDGGAGTDTVSYATSFVGADVNLQDGTATEIASVISGRYLRVYLPTADWLSLAEVKIFAGGVNVATSGTATQSSTGFGGVASRAIDGVTDGNYNNGSVTHSGSDAAYNWWQVDLGAATTIGRIEIFNRTDGFSYRLADFEVVAFNTAPTGSDTYQTITAQSGATVLRIEGQIGNSATVYGAGSVDTLAGIENVIGSRHADEIAGDNQANRLLGGDGADVLDGRGGNDILVGGGGNDTFVFRPNFGNDTINDFAGGAGAGDVVEFRNGIFVDYAALQAASQQVGNDVQITVDAADSILLKNILLANLNQDDFRFL